MAWNSQLFVFCWIVGSSFARIGFIKDQSIDKVDFPPRILKTFDTGVPVGHLRPLGWQKSPEGRILEEKKMLEPQGFYDKYVKPGKPVVFRNAMDNVPAMTNWAKDDYLKVQYGDLDVHTVVKKELLSKGPKKLRFRLFIKEYKYEDWYLSNTVPQEMMKELILPDCLKCGMKSFLYESEIWMSSGGTASLLHAHADHNLHCVLSGRKDFILVDPKHKGRFDWVDGDPHPGAGYSPLDMDQINVYKYPQITEVPWKWSTLLAGDCIFVPARYLHQVRSYGRSFSSTMLWAPSPDVSFDDCQITDLKAVVPLSEVPFIWTYTHGDRELLNIRLNAVSLRHHLMVIMRDEEKLRYAVFKDFYQEIMSEVDDNMDCKDIWAMMDVNKKRTLSREQIKSMDEDILAVVAKELNYGHTHATPRDEL